MLILLSELSYVNLLRSSKHLDTVGDEIQSGYFCPLFTLAQVRVHIGEGQSRDKATLSKNCNNNCIFKLKNEKSKVLRLTV